MILTVNPSLLGDRPLTNLTEKRLKSIRDLSCWHTSVDPQPIAGGRTNANFLVTDRGEKFFVRLGEDIPVHQVMRFNELAASRAAHEAGISPAIFHSEPGVLVLEYLDAKTLSAEEVRSPNYLPRVVDLIGRCHRDIQLHLRGPVLVFWVFHVIRDQFAFMKNNTKLKWLKSPKHMIMDFLYFVF